MSILAILGYASLAFLVYGAGARVSYHLSKKLINAADAEAVGWLWPIAWPIIGFIFAVKYSFYVLDGDVFKDMAKIKIKRKPTIGMMKKGVPRPSYILAGMVAAEMLKHPDKYEGATYFSMRLDKFKISYDGVDVTLTSGKSDMLFPHEEDKKVVLDAAAKCYELKKAMDANRLEYDRQLEATNVIDLLFKTEPTPVKKLSSHDEAEGYDGLHDCCGSTYCDCDSPLTAE